MENVNKKEKEECAQAGKSSGRCYFVAESSWYPEEIVVISKRDILPPGEKECGSEDDKWEVGVVGWLAAWHDHHQSAWPETEKSFWWWWWAKSRSKLIILALIICSLHFCHIIILKWMNAVILLLISDHLLKRLSNHFHRDKLKLNLKPKFHHCSVARISVNIEVLYCLLQHLNDQHHHRSSLRSLCNISATCFFSRLLSIPSRMPVSANHGQIATCWAKQNLGRNPARLFYQWQEYIALMTTTLMPVFLTTFASPNDRVRATTACFEIWYEMLK